MGTIHLLDPKVRELISAGEVVERPASVVKELIENSLDAGATKIEVELRRNGLGSITVTDNGKGMSREDIPVAFMRHATSKIRDAEDLDAIGTLGFRGEALAAICAVSKVKLVSRTEDSPLGYEYVIEGGTEVSLDECGAAPGTRITVSDIFYNTPARMKFLKKDVYEGNAIEEVIWHVALTNPEVSFRLVRDGKQTLRTSGQGLYAAVFDLYPRETASRMIPVDFTDEGVHIEGHVCDPSDSKASRSLQHLCVNGRYVKNRTIQSAVEEAYRSFMMRGKYPPFVLSVWLPYDQVDVNVHPAKTEIRFRNERAVSSAAYRAVKAAVTGTASAPVEQKPTPEAPEDTKPALQVRPQGNGNVGIGGFHPAPTVSPRTGNGRSFDEFEEFFTPRKPFDQEKYLSDMKALHETAAPEQMTLTPEGQAEPVSQVREELKPVGTLFDTYIVTQSGDTVYFIDMHAAHERILYEQLRDAEQIESQLFFEPVVVALSPDEKTALLAGKDLLDKLGFIVDEIGEREVAVRGVPTYLKQSGVEAAVTELAASMASGKEDATFEQREWLYHSVACRAAIKAGHRCPPEEMVSLTEKILWGDIPKYCPHGRPVYFSMTRNEIERKFGRIV